MLNSIDNTSQRLLKLVEPQGERESFQLIKLENKYCTVSSTTTHYTVVYSSVNTHCI